jgi:predicted nucleic acid-binding protein
VLVEALFLPNSAAAAVMRLVDNGGFEIITCQAVIKDVENAILKKLTNTPKRPDKIIDRWERLLNQRWLKISPDPPTWMVRETYERYIATMRHKADIQILAAALVAKPTMILSGNREHFNDQVSHKCGIRISSCVEFIELLASAAP